MAQPGRWQGRLGPKLTAEQLCGVKNLSSSLRDNYRKTVKIIHAVDLIHTFQWLQNNMYV